ncbi:MAG: alpha/beta fold hydrolase [Proteobacteria bacterium]|nr:alpha/beta fold hydrolase [Pseudomonadota bacterium]
MGDGTGDVMSGELNMPAGTRRRLVVLIHGLSGCADSLYIRASARHFAEEGFPVLRLNLRGAGPTRDRCRQLYHAGRSGDLRAAFAALAKLEPEMMRTGIFAAGYSLGANLLIKYLAEQGADTPVAAAAAVSTPIDLKATSLRLMAPRNAVYQLYLLNGMRYGALGARAELTPTQREAVLGARSVYEFDDRVTAPRAGFKGAEEYYAASSTGARLAEIKVPTLVLHARDDPWIPVAAYDAIDWRRMPKLTPVLPDAGGHVGFHAADSRTPWHDRCVSRFFTLSGSA